MDSRLLLISLAITSNGVPSMFSGMTSTVIAGTQLLHPPLASDLSVVSRSYGLGVDGARGDNSWAYREIVMLTEIRNAVMHSCRQIALPNQRLLRVVRIRVAG